MKPNFEAMSRKELLAHVLAHREDEDAFQALLRRRSPDDQAIWYHFPNTEAGNQQMEALFRRNTD